MRIPFLITLLALLARPMDAAGHAGNYRQFFPNGECAPEAFEIAWRGYQILLRDSLLRRPEFLTIVDYTKPSNRRRLFVLHLKAKRVVVSSIVAHGIGSDPDSSTVPRYFGNRNNSRMTSLGFYITGEVYTNHRPIDSLGLCLFGLDLGFNDSAAAREIVLHYGATEYSGRVYVTDSGAARSFGCPAMPLSTNTRVIRMIEGGSLLFIYSARSATYPRHSTVLNRKLKLPIVQHGPPPNNCSCNIRRGMKQE